MSPQWCASFPLSVYVCMCVCAVLVHVMLAAVDCVLSFCWVTLLLGHLEFLRLWTVFCRFVG